MKNRIIISFLVVVTLLLVSCSGNEQMIDSEQEVKVNVDTSMENAPPKTGVDIVTKEELEQEVIEKEESNIETEDKNIIESSEEESDILDDEVIIEEEEKELQQEQQTIEIKTSGVKFSPDEITINAGDIVKFTTGSSHNAVEIDEDTWNSGGGNALDGGFEVGFGKTKEITFETPGTYYYVCQPHAGMGMKGKIIVE